MGIDQADASRIAGALQNGAYLSEIDADRWDTIRKRLARNGASGARIPSSRDPFKIVVIANIEPTPDAIAITDVQAVLLDVMITRPTGQTRRLTTFGDVASRDEWFGTNKAEAIQGDDDWMSQLVQPADVELIATALGVEVSIVESRGGTSVRLRCKWDDWRAEAVRRWCKNPSGKRWADMRRETLIREGVELEHPPPMELYDEAAA